MKSFRVVSAVIVGMLLLAGLSYLYSSELASFFNDLGWGKAAGLFSGAWWNSLPTLILAVAAMAAVYQIVHVRQNTQAQLAMSVFQELRSPEALEKLRAVYRLPEGFCVRENVPSPSKDQEGDIDYILDRFDLLAVLVQERVVDSKLAIDAYAGVSSLRCWYRLHEYIRQCRDERGYYGDNFEAFVRQSLDYFRHHDITVSLYIEGTDTNRVVLTDALSDGPLHPRKLSEIRKQRKDEATKVDKTRSCGGEPQETGD